jgi:hypothetical protein
MTIQKKLGKNGSKSLGCEQTSIQEVTAVRRFVLRMILSAAGATVCRPEALVMP